MIRKHLYICLVALILATNAAIYAGLPIYRLVLGMVIFCFLPGYLILYILFDVKNKCSEFVLSICLSLILLIGVGMIVNEILFNTLGIRDPLEAKYLAPAYTAALFSLLLFAYYSTPKTIQKSLNIINPKICSVVTLISLSLIIFSYTATRHMTVTLDNVPLIIVYLVSAGWISLIFVSRRIPSDIYPIALVLIGVALIIPLSFRSNYIWGTDIQLEFWYMAQIEARSHWEILRADSLLAGVLSANFLPVILNRLLGTDPMMIFKVIIPLLFSTSAVGVYALASTILSKDQAYLAATLFMATNGYLLVAQFIRTSLAIFFLLGAMLTLVSIQEQNKRSLLFIIIFTAVVVSHYTTSFILLMVIFVYMAWVSIATYQTSHTQIPQFSIPLFSLYVILIVSWQIYISYGAIERGIGIISSIVVTILVSSDGTGEETRDTDVQSLLATRIAELDIPHYVQFFVSWAIITLIGIGLLVLGIHLLKDRSSVDSEEVIIGGLGSAGAALLGSYVFLPFVSGVYGLSRTILLAFILVSPTFVVGCKALSDLVEIESLKKMIPVLIIALFLLSNAGVTYQMAGYDRGHALVTEEAHHWEHVHDTDYAAAEWLYFHKDNRDIRSDRGPFYNKLKIAKPAPTSGYTSYPDGISWLRQEEALEEDGYIYLHTANVVKQQIATGKYEYEDFERYDDINNNRNRVYANGGAEVYDD